MTSPDATPATDTPDRATVQRVIAEHVHPSACVVDIRRSATGNSQETWYVETRIEDEPVDLVLRRSAAGGTLEWSDRGAEVRAIRAAAEAGLPVPTVWWWEPDGELFERASVLMERSPGGPADLNDPAACATLARELGHWLAELHRSDRAAELFGQPISTAAVARSEVERWTARARNSRLAPEALAALCGWLDANAPHDDTRSVLLWGDPGPHNVLTDGQGHVTAVLDWELATRGHPLTDLGAARWACLGQLDRELLTDTYEVASGVHVDRDALAWFEVLACVSRSVMLLDGVRATIDGRADDPNILALGHGLVTANLLHAARLAWGCSPEAHDRTGHAARLRPSIDERDRVLGRFLTDRVLPHVSDQRVRRQLRIAASLLAASSPEAAEPSSGGTGRDAWSAWEAERAGDATVEARQRLVDELGRARHDQEALRALYGATLSAPGLDD
jgi:aminoglycoside phosphotransferase (APT) family kinase protein